MRANRRRAGNKLTRYGDKRERLGVARLSVVRIDLDWLDGLDAVSATGRQEGDHVYTLYVYKRDEEKDSELGRVGKTKSGG
jgi:hypothetical protein